MDKGKLGILQVSPIVDIVDLTPPDCRLPVKSIKLSVPKIAELAQPGQFVMMWLHGIDEKPMGIASCDKKTGILEFAVAKIGPATIEFHKLKKGDLLGIRGPFGKGFTLTGKNIAIIGGGTGIAPTKFLTEYALTKGIKTTLFHGARAKNELAFLEYFEALEKQNKKFFYRPSTDDGSYGFCGFSTECYEDSHNMGEAFDQYYTCGPELMMFTAWKQAVAQKKPIQACLADRYFKCAIGLCGQCTVDPVGLRLCIDGPVFDQEQLKEITDFGKYARDKYGKKIPL